MSVSPAHPSVSVPLEDLAQAEDAGRRAVEMCRTFGMDEIMCGEAAIVVTELAASVVRRGHGGELLLRPLEGESGPALEILALDKGAARGDAIGPCGYGLAVSTVTGTGFDTVRRLASEFAIHSVPGGGTAVLAVMGKSHGAHAPSASGSPLRYGVVNLPKRGEEVCGDAWAVRMDSGRAMILVADGLGHGYHAAEASQEAVRVFHRYPDEHPGRLLEILHGALRSTRGAAVAVAEIRVARSELVYAGVGNITGVLVSGENTRNLISHNGIVGHEMRHAQEFVYPWCPGSLLIMATDGLTAQWQVSKHPALANKPPSLIAGVLYRDHNRGRDDATVVVVR